MSGTERIVNEIDLSTGEISRLIPLKENSEDYCWMPGRILLTGSGSKLYRFDPGADSDWVEIADFLIHGIRNISRIAVNSLGNKIAIVSSR